MRDRLLFFVVFNDWRFSWRKEEAKRRSCSLCLCLCLLFVFIIFFSRKQNRDRDEREREIYNERNQGSTMGVKLVLAASSFCHSSVLFWLPFRPSVEQRLSWDGGITLILHNYLQGLVLVFLLPFVFVLLSHSLSSSRRRYLELKEVELYHYPHH